MTVPGGRRLLGVAIGLALATTSGIAFAENAAERAVEAAKQYAGETLSITWEAGIQAQELISHSGPIWEQLTGVRINVVEIPINELFTRTIAEHRAGTGAYDMLSVVPAWMPDMVRAGVLEPLDSYVDKYGYMDELDDIAPTYRNNQMTYGDQIFGLPDDGDVFLLYYRSDLFGDKTNQAAFREAYGYDLAPPKTWNEFYDISKFFTDTGGGDLFGSALILSPGLVHYLYEMRLRTAGGRFFDPETMDAQINSEIAVAVLEDMVRQLDNMPPGAAGWGPIEVLNAWLAGELAMQIWWPPPGRWSAGYGVDAEELFWLPESTIAGNVGYALPPGGHPELAAGFVLCVSSNSRNKELAYLFAQWLNSRDVSITRITLPFALRDPFRTSHFNSTEYKALWPTAKDYLAALEDAAETGLFDLSIIDTFAYEESLTRAIVAALLGQDARTVLDQAAREWNEITEEIGIDDQREAYKVWSSKPGAYPN